MKHASNQKSTRRNFFRHSLLGIGGIVSLPHLSFLNFASAEKVKGNLHPSLLNDPVGIYSVESGILGKDEHFALGILVSDDAESHESDLANIRGQVNYRTRLTYPSNDAFKMPFALSVINYFNSTEGLKLYIKIVSDTSSNLSPQAASLAKLGYYRQLFQRSSSDISGQSIRAKSQSPYGPSPFFSNLFTNEFSGAVLDVNTTYDNNLLQLASFLLGTILLDIRTNSTSRSSIKKRLNQSFKETLNIENFSTNSVVGDDKIVII